MVSRYGGRKEPTMHCFVSHCGHPQPQHHAQPAPPPPSLSQFRIISANTGRPDVSFHVAATAFPPQQGGGAAPPGGPQLRGLHHPHHGANPSLPPAHQQQPPPPSQTQHSGGPPGPAPTSTPPGPADMGKNGPPHLQGQPQMQQGGQMPLNFVPNQARPNQSQAYFAGPRGPTPRMPNHRGQVVNMSTNNVGQQIFPSHVPNQLMPMYTGVVPTPINPNQMFVTPGQMQMFPATQTRHQGAGTGFYSPTTGQQQMIMQHQQIYQGFQSGPQAPFFFPGVRGTGMAGASGVGGPGLGGGASQPVVVPGGPSQMGQTGQVSMMPIAGSNVIVPGLPGDSGTPSGPVSSSSSSTGGKPTRRKHALDIVDPRTMKQVEIYESSGSSTPPRSGDSSARETPQPSSVTGTLDVVAEFAARVAKAAHEETAVSSGAQAPYSNSSVGGPQVVNINGPDVPVNSIPPPSDGVLNQSDTSVSKPPIVVLEEPVSSWKQTSSKPTSIGNKSNSHIKPNKVETSSSKVEDQGPIDNENVVSQEHNVSSVNVKEVNMRQHDIPIAPTLGQPVIPNVTSIKEHSSGVLAVEPNSTPVVSAITNSPDIELVHHRPSSREQFQGIKSSTPAAHQSPRRKPQRTTEAAPVEKVATSQSVPALASLPAPTPVTQVSSASSVSVTTSAEPKPQKEHTPPASAIAETKLMTPPASKKSSPAPEQPAVVEENVFVAPPPKEQREKARGRDRSSQGKETEKAREKSQGHDREKSSRSRETTPHVPATPVTRVSTPPLETAPTIRSATKPASTPPAEETTPKHQANGEAVDAFEGKASQQRSKHGKRGQQKKELNRKGAEKEGTEMDAFAEPPAPVTQAPSVVPPAASPTASPVTEPPAAPVASAAVPAASATTPPPAPARAASPTIAAAPAPPPVVAPAAAPPAVNNKIVDSAETKKEDLDVDKEEEEKIVAARNEENTKVSAATANSTFAAVPAPEKTPVIEQAPPVKPVTAKQPVKEESKPAAEPQCKKYERDFLYSLKNAPLSKLKPENLPDLEVVLKDPRPSRSIDITRGPHDTLLPKFVGVGPGSRGGVPPKRGSQQGKAKVKQQGLIHLSISLKEDVKLRETENAWKPARIKAAELPEEQAKSEDLYKKVRGVLNRLTPQKFSTLVQQVQSLPIDNSERLRGVINLVFDKAIDEPGFSVGYAQMCKVLSNMQVPADRKDENSQLEFVNFRKLIVNRCQQEFEKNTEAELNKEERLKEISNCKDPEKKKELQLQFEEESRKVRMKSVGNIRFIGELFKLQMLTTTIMHRCIRQLLSDGEEESLECLCKLLTTIGKDLELKNVQDLSSYFDKMRGISQKRGEISSRVRFMLQDVIELRQSKWVPRRDENNPKTIDQIQKEAEKEAVMEAMNVGPPSGARRGGDDRGGDRRKNRGGGGGGGGGAGEDGWSLAGRSRNYSVDTTRFKQKIVETDNLSLGCRSNYTNWNSNSKAADTGKKSSGPVYSNNSFAALQDMAEEKRMPSLATGRPSSNKLAPSASSEKERMLAGYKSATEELRPQHMQQSRSSSRDNAPRGGRDDSHARLPSATPSGEDTNRGSPEVSPLASDVPLMAEDHVRNHTMVLLDEYFNNSNESETAQSVAETFGEANISAFVLESLNSVLEKTIQARQNVGKLMCHLIKENVVTKPVFCASLSQVVSDGDDLAIDIPKIWLYLAEIIVPLLSAEVISFSEFRNVAKNVNKLVVEVLHLLVKDKGPAWTRERWDAGGLNWTDFVEPSKVDSFVKQHELEFTMRAVVPSQSSAPLSMEEVQKKLLQFLKPEQGAAHSFDEICDWIGANVGDRVKETQFIRALMTALCESAISQSSKLKEETLAQHGKFFQKYVDNKEELELQCLFAVQALVHRLDHPQGLVCNIFNVLSENDFISRDSFIAWETTDNPCEQLGKGVALKSLTSFFTALREAEDESEES